MTLLCGVLFANVLQPFTALAPCIYIPHGMCLKSMYYGSPACLSVQQGHNVLGAKSW